MEAREDFVTRDSRFNTLDISGTWGILGGGYLLDWIQLKVEEWVERVETLGRFAVIYLQVAYGGLKMLIQME